jgi:hypothetical protein
VELWLQGGDESVSGENKIAEINRRMILNG